MTYEELRERLVGIAALWLAPQDQRHEALGFMSETLAEVDKLLVDPDTGVVWELDTDG
jgi:hypothetical protein